MQKIGDGNVGKMNIKAINKITVCTAIDGEKVERVTTDNDDVELVTVDVVDDVEHVSGVTPNDTLNYDRKPDHGTSASDITDTDKYNCNVYAVVDKIADVHVAHVSNNTIRDTIKNAPFQICNEHCAPFQICNEHCALFQICNEHCVKRAADKIPRKPNELLVNAGYMSGEGPGTGSNSSRRTDARETEHSRGAAGEVGGVPGSIIGPSGQTRALKRGAGRVDKPQKKAVEARAVTAPSKEAAVKEIREISAQNVTSPHTHRGGWGVGGPDHVGRTHRGALIPRDERAGVPPSAPPPPPTPRQLIAPWVGPGGGGGGWW